MMELDPRERRKEPREDADAELTLVVDDPLPAEVRGRLVDVSRSGFRARHAYPRFEPGQRVRFRSAASQGLARVIWNRILNDRVETGFLLL
jgi:hypothetical protein